MDIPEKIQQTNHVCIIVMNFICGLGSLHKSCDVSQHDNNRHLFLVQSKIVCNERVTVTVNSKVVSKQEPWHLASQSVNCIFAVRLSG